MQITNVNSHLKEQIYKIITYTNINMCRLHFT